MGDLQMIFVVESNSTCKSDWIYIKDTIEQFYQYDRAHVKLSVIYMDGKGKYSNKEKVIASQIKTYQNAVKNGASRRSIVIYCFDCDEYDTNQEDLVFLDKAEQYCAHHAYDFVWFCKDVEQVYLGKRVDKGKKKKEAEAFRCRRIIESISENRLSVAKYRIGSSNIMKVLDKYLERCTDT